MRGLGLGGRRHVRITVFTTALLAATQLDAAAPPGYVEQTFPLDTPAVGLAYDADGLLWVLEEAGFGNNTASLRALHQNGQFGQEAFTVVGDDPSNLFVGGMAYDPVGNQLLITDNTADGRLYRMFGGVQETLATGLPAIAGVAVRETGEIFVSTAAGNGMGGVYQIDRETGAATPVLSGLDFGAALAFDAAGDLIVQDAASTEPYLGRLQKLPIIDGEGGVTFGQPTTIIASAPVAAGVMVDDEGDLYISGTDGVYTVSDGAAAPFFATGDPRQFATAMTLSPGATPFEPFAGAAGRRMAIAEYGFGIEEPFITLITSAMAEDFDSSGVVDGADLSVWAASVGSTATSPSEGDATGDGVVDGADFLQWQRAAGSTVLWELPEASSAGAVPEPDAFLGFLVSSVLFTWQIRARR